METGLRWKLVEHVMVATQDDDEVPEESLFQRQITDLDSGAIRAFIFHTQRSPKLRSVQRSQLVSVLQKRGIRLAVISDSTVVGGIATAMSWFYSNVKTFKSNQLQKAFEWFRIEGKLQQLIKDEYKELGVVIS
jgi:hypothetical protein